MNYANYFRIKYFLGATACCGAYNYTVARTSVCPSSAITPAVYDIKTWCLVLGWGFRLSLDVFPIGAFIQALLSRVTLALAILSCSSFKPAIDNIAGMQHSGMQMQWKHGTSDVVLLDAGYSWPVRGRLGRDIQSTGRRRVQNARRVRAAPAMPHCSLATSCLVASSIAGLSWRCLASAAWPSLLLSASSIATSDAILTKFQQRLPCKSICKR